ncbi:MAG: pseudouridine synthase [Uliginosibacterium sp.]|nr:pseudouridine synthase [Uliginosibacterium sp.]
MKPDASAVPLPTRHGVSPSSVVLPQAFWPSIADFLVARFPALSADTWAQRIAAGDVVDETGQVVTPYSRYKPGLRVYYYRALDDETPIPFAETIVFQDDLLVVVDKPHFLPVTPGGRYLQETLMVRLKRKLGLETLNPIHRIDRETAGLVVFAVQPHTRAAYHALFAERRVHKVYEAIAPFRADLVLPCDYRCRLEDSAHFMQMQSVSGEPNSETGIECLASNQALAHYRLTPVSGKRHQLRVHLAALGVPICFDRIYPRLLPENTDDYDRPLQLLAKQISFRDPVSGERRCFETQRALLGLDQVAARMASAP